VGTCTCTGEAACASNPACKIDLGSPCTKAGDCSGGFCVGGVCCDGACTGSCEGCAGGHCKQLPAKTPVAACGAYLCGGASDCPATCDADAACTPGHYCSANHACAPYCSGDKDCPTSTYCDPATKKCASGAHCDGDHTLTLGSKEQKDCSPYVCLAEGVCRTDCQTSADCIRGASCDDTNHCVTAAASEPEPPAGCACTASRQGASWAPWSFAAAMIVALLRRRRRRGAVFVLGPPVDRSVVAHGAKACEPRFDP
jgi:MYXO-CTERM domain-containing protein